MSERGTRKAVAATARARAPVWLAALWTPTLVSVSRCASCCRVYRRLHRGPCLTCRGRVVWWKRCSKCLRWKSADGFYPANGGATLQGACRRCHSMRVSAAWSKRYWTDAQWAEQRRTTARAHYRRRRGGEERAIA